MRKPRHPHSWTQLGFLRPARLIEYRAEFRLETTLHIGNYDWKLPLILESSLGGNKRCRRSGYFPM
jgi:hypothetical protein